MRISISKSVAIVLSNMAAMVPLRVGKDLMPQVSEFRYLRILFISEGKMEWEIDRREGGASRVVQTLHHLLW